MSKTILGIELSNVLQIVQDLLRISEYLQQQKKHYFYFYFLLFQPFYQRNFVKKQEARSQTARCGSNDTHP